MNRFIASVLVGMALLTVPLLSSADLDPHQSNPIELIGVSSDVMPEYRAHVARQHEVVKAEVITACLDCHSKDTEFQFYFLPKTRLAEPNKHSLTGLEAISYLRHIEMKNGGNHDEVKEYLGE